MTKSSIWFLSVYDGLTIVNVPKCIRITKTFLMEYAYKQKTHSMTKKTRSWMYFDTLKNYRLVTVLDTFKNQSECLLISLWYT